MKHSLVSERLIIEPSNNLTSYRKMFEFVVNDDGSLSMKYPRAKPDVDVIKHVIEFVKNHKLKVDVTQTVFGMVYSLNLFVDNKVFNYSVPNSDHLGPEHLTGDEKHLELAKLVCRLIFHS